MIFVSGNNYTSELVPIQQYLAYTTLGNMGSNSFNVVQQITQQWQFQIQDSSILIVSIDLLITLTFVFAIFRLKHFESLTAQDLKNGTLRVNDFTVHLPDIPVSKDLYFNNPELLTAMLVVLLEDVVRNEVQVIQEIEQT